MMKYNVGDEVYWNDPDNGNLSGYYFVKAISCYLPVVYVIGEGTEVFEWELS